MTEQEKRKKVIKGIEACLGDTRSALPNLCTICPYSHGSYATQTCDKQLREDALALLKAQEPSVMTWEEAQVNMKDGPFIIFEVRDSTGSEVDFGILVGDYYEMSEGSVLTVADFWMLKDGYGKRFRLWTSRPTDEQREATPWT